MTYKISIWILWNNNKYYGWYLKETITGKIDEDCRLSTDLLLLKVVTFKKRFHFDAQGSQTNDKQSKAVPESNLHLNYN